MSLSSSPAAAGRPAPVVASVGASGRVALVVTAKDPVADGVVRLRLEAPGGLRLPDWTPGAHIDLGLPNGLTRQYSLCGDRWDPRSYEIAVLREPDGRGGSAFVHDHLAVGDGIEVGGPRNHFPLVPADRYLFVAGGIGITPMLPMIEQATMLDTPWSLLYGGRRRVSMAFVDRLARWGDRVTLWPQDSHGLLDLASAVDAEPSGTKIYCCGPAPLLAAVESVCTDRPVGHLRIERFEAREQGPPVRTTGYEVELARTGTVLGIQPGDSVLDALAAAGAPVLASCRQGVCGTCETTVLAGTPDHRDSLLDEAQRRRNDCFYPCVSRSASDRLVLDL
ncbi:PDR/VanB family oxidoreductase [Nocardioides zeae]|uniref:Ferredoxin-NADP reductase n=1 Tax=Nocardioides zeae TaxID=1457234 RepID=A0AAJ1U1G5_9ACTN|nr:PDR/VanB family oxidoreductase [Nocardioides zeae]MDQ1105629.1 ferredoxin-NADP reductase [Nocardioides zeae]